MKRAESLPLKFYRRDTEIVARDLLGKKLFCRNGDTVCAGRIIETEAYLGVDDPACHTFRGRQTDRVRSMYKSGGHAYVYLIYGIHFCFNVVSKNEKSPEAVLVRALLPTDGIGAMAERRKTSALSNLCSGPGKLCQALGIDRSYDGLELSGPEIWIAKDPTFVSQSFEISASPRVGIDYAGDATAWPLRFQLSEKRKVRNTVQRS